MVLVSRHQIKKGQLVCFLYFKGPRDDTFSVFSFDFMFTWLKLSLLWTVSLDDEIVCNQNLKKRLRVQSREDEGRERIPHTWAYSDENYLKSIFDSVSYCVVILRTTPHWSVKMTSRNFRLLTSEQQIKITFASLVRTNNKFVIIIIGHGDSLSYFILSWYNANVKTKELKLKRNVFQSTIS